MLRHLLRVQHRLTELRVGDFEVAGRQLGLLFRAAQLVLGAPALGHFLAQRARPILDHRLELARPLAGAADVQAEEAAAAQQDQGADPELEQPPLVVAGLELYRQLRSLKVPDAVVVLRDDLEAVRSRRDVRVIGFPAVPGLHPVGGRTRRADT